MRTCYWLMIFYLVFAWKMEAQMMLKTEYIGASSFRDGDNKKVGKAKGSAITYQGLFSIPFFVKMNENNRPTAWGVMLSGTYTSLDNKHMLRDWAPDEIMNVDFAFMHVRPVKKNMSIMVAAGMGGYAPGSKLAKHHLMGNGAALVIFHLKHNLDIGGGIAINNTFGYPMVFPGLVIQWKKEGKFELDVQLMNAAEVGASYLLKDYLKLRVFGELNGAMTMEKREGKKMMFTHQYVNTGIQPVFLLGKGFTLPVTIGVTPYRGAFYQERSLKAFFKDDGKDHDPHFSVAPYFSISLRYGL